jgi:hypothetical protein
MNRTLISIVAAMFVAGSASAASLLHLSATNPDGTASGSVSTVTATLTIDGAGAVIPALGTISLQVGWNNTVVRVVGSNGTTTFGKSSQSAMLTTSAGTITPALTPWCVSAGVQKGKACTIINQSSVGGATVNPNQVVIGTLLLELLPAPGGPDPIGTLLGLIVTQYNNAGITNPGDASLTIDPSFTTAQIVPEPTTAALLGLGLLGLGFVGRRRA